MTELRGRFPGDPFLRSHLGDESVRTIWANGAAFAVTMLRMRSGHGRELPWLVCAGDPSDAASLVAELFGAGLVAPAGVTIPAAAELGVPAQWRTRVTSRWAYDLMWTADRPRRHRVNREVQVLADAPNISVAINAVLDAGFPDCHSRPGDPAVRDWVGTADDSARLVAVGALTIAPTGVASLRSITTVPAERGEGYGSAVTAFLTARGLEHVSDVVTLAVMSDNIGAIAMYEALGFRRGGHFLGMQVAT